MAHLGMTQVCTEILAAAVDVPDLDLAVKARREQQMAPLRKEAYGIDTLHGYSGVRAHETRLAKAATLSCYDSMPQPRRAEARKPSRRRAAHLRVA